MREIKEMITVREQELQQLIHTKKMALQGAAEGRLHSSPHKNSVQFYRILPDKTKEYLKKGDIAIRQLAQKEYDENILKAAQKEQELIRQLQYFYEKQKDPESQYSKMLPSKRAFIMPIQVPDDEYVRSWLARPYVGLGFRDDTEGFYLNNGERVRSKSELLIADLLRKKGIPYRYERPLTLNAGNYETQVVYPDFTILRIRDRQELYWEHLGLLEDPEYLMKNLRKIRQYEANGYFPGQKLILSFETSATPLNLSLIERKIEAYCK